MPTLLTKIAGTLLRLSGPQITRKLEYTKSFKSLVWSVALFLYSTPLFAFDYTNSQLGFNVTLPDGLDDFSTNMRIKSLISRASVDASKKGLIELVAVQDMGGPIGREDLSKKPNKPENTTLEKTAWKGFDVDVFKVVENIRGVSFVTFNAQVPLKPHAIQIMVSGPTYDENKLRKEAQTIVASVQGPTNWLTDEERRARLQQNFIAIAIGLFALIFGKLRITRHYGLAGTGARVAGFLIFVAGLVLPKLTVPVLIFVHSHGADTGAVLVTWVLFNCAVIWAIIAILIHLYGNAYARDLDKAVPQAVTTPPPIPPSAMFLADCPMCQRPIPPEQQRTAKTCPNCGADLSRWRR